MMYKRCAYCMTRYQYDKKCECVKNRTALENKERHKSYDLKRDKAHKSFYSSSDWQRVREQALINCNYLDLYSLYMFDKIEQAEVVHHIVEISEDFSKRFDINNLIGLTNSNHQLIHSKYKTNKAKTQQLLLDILEQHREGVLKKYI